MLVMPAETGGGGGLSTSLAGGGTFQFSSEAAGLAARARRKNSPGPSRRCHAALDPFAQPGVNLLPNVGHHGAISQRTLDGLHIVSKARLPQCLPGGRPP